MGRLYRNKYLIAVYDKTDEVLLGVFEKPSEMKDLMGMEVATVATIVWRAIRYVEQPQVVRNYKYVLHFIDVFEKHDDCFAYEDALFLKEFGYQEVKDEVCETEL